MAFVDPTQDPEQENQNPSQVDQALNPSASAQAQQQSQNQQVAPSTSAGGAGVASAGSVGGAGAAGPSASPTPKPSSSGSWTNLDQYLNANSDQAVGLGQQIASTVNNAGNTAQNDITNLGVNFNSAVNQNVVNQDQNAVDSAVNAATSATASQGLTPDQVASFQKQSGANYSGPNDVTAFNGYNQAQQDINQATQLANQTKSESGRGTLLNKQFQNTSQYGYTQGENNLDQLLLQNSPGGQAALQPLADQWSGLTGALNNTVTSGNQAATTANTTDQATATNARNSLATAEANFENQLNTGLSNLQTTNSNAYNQVAADLASGKLTPDDYTKLGIDPTVHNYLQNNALGTYLTQGAAPTLASYATPDQYAQAAALAELAGQPTSSFLAPGSASQAGTAETTPAFTFDTGKYSSDNATAHGEYNNAQSFLLNQMNQGFFTSAGTPETNWGFTSIEDAVNKLNYMVGQFYGAGGGYGEIGAWALQQMKNLNALQANYNLPQYPIPGQAVSVVKT